MPLDESRFPHMRMGVSYLRKDGPIGKDVMRIAVASNGLDVCSHFSCCTNFNYYKVEYGQLVDSRNLPSQGHLCGSQANFLRQIGVKVMICANISPKDVASMEEAGITVVRHAGGRAIEAAQVYVEEHQGELVGIS